MRELLRVLTSHVEGRGDAILCCQFGLRLSDDGDKGSALLLRLEHALLSFPADDVKNNVDIFDDLIKRDRNVVDDLISTQTTHEIGIARWFVHR